MQPADDSARRRLIAVASQALGYVKAGQHDDAVRELVTIDINTEPAIDSTSATDAEGAARRRAGAREAVLLLFSECSAMVATLGSGGTAPVKLQVYDDSGNEVSIDDADPPMRTAVRTLLASVHGDTDAATAQVEIALASAEPDELAEVVLQALRWTINLAGECAQRDLPVPQWISSALAD